MQVQTHQMSKAAVIEAGAAAILHSAARAIEMILARRHEMDRAGQAATPLVVLAGEKHSQPTCYIHHMLLLDGLSREVQTVAGLEFPHNQIELGRGYDPGKLARLKADDRRGEISQMNACGFWFQTAADHSNIILFRFLLRRDIAVRFVDAACPGAMLDYKDPSTLRSFNACQRQASSGVSVLSPGGEHVRNHHMAAMSVDFARETGAKIIVVRCGATHVAGRYDKHEGRHSLSAEFRKLALPVIGMLPEKFALPTNPGLMPHDTIRMTGLPSLTISYDAADRTGRAVEAAYINALLEDCGMGYETLTLEEHADFKAHCRKSLDAVLPLHCQR